MRVAITGHRPDAFIQSHYSEGQVQLIADGVVATFQRQYGSGQHTGAGDDCEIKAPPLAFNVGGCIGADQWVGRACIGAGVPYYLFMPMTLEVQSRYWSQNQTDELRSQVETSEGVDIVDPSGNYSVQNYFIRDRRMVDNADIVVAFWVGKKKGGTYQTMKYALKQSKFVFNALDGLRPVFSEDLQKGWTPPVQGE